LRTRDVQQSRANQTTGRSLEENARRSKRRNGRPNYGRRRFFRIQPPTGPFDSCGQFSCRRGRSGENRGIKKAGGAAAADFAFEQVRTRAGTNNSHRNGGDDGGGAGSDEEVIFERRERRVAVSDRAARTSHYHRPSGRCGPTARSESRFNGFSPLAAQTMTLD